MKPVAAALVIALAFAASPAQSEAERAKAFFDLLVKQDFAGAVATFNDAMLKAMPEAKLKEFWTTVISQAGAFQKHESERVEPRGANRTVILRSAFARMKADVSISIDAAGRVGGLGMRPVPPPPLPSAPPAYADPASFTERDVVVGSGEWQLPGTLSTPAGAGPFPAVVLVHGSGPNDRDESIGPNRPFRDLAHGLASRGVAVLRYDKRSRVHGARMASIPRMTVQHETVDDAVAGVALLMSTPLVARDRVFVLGHSLGGMLLPRIAAGAPGAAGFIAMAAPARALERAMLEQTEYLANADGVVMADEQARIDAMRALSARVAALTEADAGSRENIGGAPASYWLDLRGFDAPEAARVITRPLLVLQGERDYQVMPAEYERWKTSLAGRAGVTFKSYPALNHLFIAGTGRSVPLEYSLPGHVAEEVVRDIADWIKVRISHERFLPLTL
ncbi:MAG: alpha/beta fold hydrolase [Acidobacteriota bacterium]|nr:alpha/beta fold hydrolase [Acidobacteriota bacterium]